MSVHVINPLLNAFGGSELRSVAYYREFSSHAQTLLWSESEPAAELKQLVPIQRLGADHFPRGGTLVFVGCYFAVGEWLRRAHPSRVLVVVNTPALDVVRSFLDRLAALGISTPELVYAAAWMRDAFGAPGRLDLSPIDLNRFVPRESPPPGKSGFVVGRLSRDVLGKHHPNDPRVYQALVRAGVQVSLMGAGCIAPMIGPLPADRFTSYRAGEVAAEAFLNGLDCFYYRTHPSWFEPHGRVVTEAMACGLPVVCDSQGGYAEFIDNGVDGFLFSGDEEAIELINYLRHAPVIRARIGRAARQKILDLHARRASFVTDVCAP